MTVQGMRWVEKGNRDVWMLEDQPHHYRGWVIKVTDKEYQWYVCGTTIQGECQTRRRAQDKVEEQVRVLVFG